MQFMASISLDTTRRSVVCHDWGGFNGSRAAAADRMRAALRHAAVFLIGHGVNPLTIPATMTQGLLVLTAAADAPRDGANVQIVGTASAKTPGGSW